MKVTIVIKDTQRVFVNAVRGSEEQEVTRVSIAGAEMDANTVAAVLHALADGFEPTTTFEVRP